MTAIVIANIVLAAAVLLAICGGLIWTIVRQPDAGPLVCLPRLTRVRRTSAPATARLSRSSI